jgi:glycolate oxidase iron-sulfur subunit
VSEGHAGIFDAHRPPEPERIADCVHCGFCLPTCPTYLLWGEEMDSPRGRIWLMKLGHEERVDWNPTYVQHFDRCLGCMACVTACPSGVRYHELIEDMRPQIERHAERGLAERAFRRLVWALFPHPGRLRVVSLPAWAYQRLGLRALAHRLGLARRLPPRLAAMESLLPRLRLRALVRRTPARVASSGPVRRRIGLLTGCVQRVYFGHVNDATARVLATEGCEVVAPRGQGCCGALMVHAGEEPGALACARALIDVFEAAAVDTVVVNAAGCGSTMKEYGRLLADDPAYAERAQAFAAKVRDVSELLAELEPRAERRPLAWPRPATVPGGSGGAEHDLRVAYHDACHLQHAQGVTAQPRALLAAIPGVRVVDLAGKEICCGSAGIYNLLEPEAAADLGRRKAAAARAVAPDVIASANPGCLLQLRRHLDVDVPLVHPVELLDASLAGGAPRGVRRRAGAATTAAALALAAGLWAWRRRVG